MKPWYKRLFCLHIWKDTSRSKLGRFRWVAHNMKSDTFTRYAVDQLCLKCGAVRKIERDYYDGNE